MPKPSVSAMRLAGRAPVGVRVTPGSTPPSGPTTRPSMAPVVVWAVAAVAAARVAPSSPRAIDPLLLIHIPHLLLAIGQAVRAWRERGRRCGDWFARATDGTEETIARRVRGRPARRHQTARRLRLLRAFGSGAGDGAQQHGAGSRRGHQPDGGGGRALAPARGARRHRPRASRQDGAGE